MQSVDRQSQGVTTRFSEFKDNPVGHRLLYYGHIVEKDMCNPNTHGSPGTLGTRKRVAAPIWNVRGVSATAAVERRRAQQCLAVSSRSCRELRVRAKGCKCRAPHSERGHNMESSRYDTRRQAVGTRLQARRLRGHDRHNQRVWQRTAVEVLPAHYEACA